MKTITGLILLAIASLPTVCLAQVNTGSNGSDGAFNPTVNTVINMASHPNGIYQYTSVNIPSSVTVTFVPNANNSPVIWLVQSNVVINGTVDVSGQTFLGSQGGLGGPGGWRGGNGPDGASKPTDGQGPGGGFANGYAGGNYGSPEQNWSPNPYGNIFLIPLLGGSGGAGVANSVGGGGGGGAILIAASNMVNIAGAIYANGGSGKLGVWGSGGSGSGSGGAIRIVASRIIGSGNVLTTAAQYSGEGRVRFDAYDVPFAGNIGGNFTQGSQFVITPSVGQIPQLTVASVGGVVISASPTGALFTPDANLSAQQNNPIPIVVNCANLPLNSQITVSVKPANGAMVSATGYNTTGTLATSTATISIVIPRGGGLIYATATTSN